jgi:hypothetical protein
VAKILTGKAVYSEGAILPFLCSGAANMFEGEEDDSWDIKARIKGPRRP